MREGMKGNAKPPNVLILNGVTHRGGEGGIRTPVTVLPVKRFSKPPPSATRPPLQPTHTKTFAVDSRNPDCGAGPLRHRQAAGTPQSRDTVFIGEKDLWVKRVVLLCRQPDPGVGRNALTCQNSARFTSATVRENETSYFEVLGMPEGRLPDGQSRGLCSGFWVGRAAPG